MTGNRAVKALLTWINSTQPDEPDQGISDLKDGMLLLKVVYKQKEEAPPSSTDQPIQDRFEFIADFLQKDCRFSPGNAAALSWEQVSRGDTIEICKVILLLLYHDLMGSYHFTTVLRKVEEELATLVSRFVLERDGCVSLNGDLESYLRNESSPSHSILSMCSTWLPSGSDLASPVFHRSRSVQFVDLHTVASSSVSSPLQDVMNTPHFRMRRMKRQMIQDAEAHDSMEKELNSSLTLLEHKDSQIRELSYRLEKLTRDQCEKEQGAGQELQELLDKNQALQSRLHEVINQHQQLKTSNSQMERKVDQLTEENGTLSANMRELCSQLIHAEAEHGRLWEAQASAREEWSSRSSLLESQLNQVTSHKDLLAGQTEILQSKISSLEDELSRVGTEDQGENMGAIMQNELECEMEDTLSCLRTAQEEVKTKENLLAHYQQDIKNLLAHYQQDINQQKELLQQQIVSSDEDVTRLKESLRESENLLLQVTEKISTVSSLSAQKDQQVICLQEEKDDLLAKNHQESLQQREALQQEMEEVKRLKEEIQVLKKKLQDLERQKGTFRRLEVALQQELACLRSGKEGHLEETDKLTRGFQEQLVVQTEAAEHYKTKMEKAYQHYNTKKRVFQDSQDQVTELQRSLEVKQHEIKAVTTENTLLQLDLEKAHTNENTLLAKVASLQAQLARVKQPAISQDDSLELSCLDDYLDEVPHSKYPNTTMRPSGPEDCSTPSVHSSERLATKWHTQVSLDSLYFTPLNSRRVKRSRAGRHMESLTSTAADLCLDSAKRPLPSSTKRRRTTQVINITMTQKTRSQPNLSSTHASRPISMEPLDPPADMATGGSSGQLGNLPGYRRSTAHPLPPRSSGTFCVGTENEPDLLSFCVRIARLQASYQAWMQACLPRLKSSYPLESRSSLCPDFTITDEDLRLGDPSETIRRASLMPDSLTGHRSSYMPGHTAGPASRGHSLMPETSSAFSQQLSLRPKGQTSSALLRPSPQTKASFPRPLTPKRNTRKPLSPASFTIENGAAAVQSRTTTTKSPRTAKSPSLAASARKVNGGSKAEQAALQPGDVILEINRVNTGDMLNVEAQNKIKNSKTQLQLVVERINYHYNDVHVSSLW